MAKQNIYDNEVFFEGYAKLRQKKGNANNLFEIPARMSLMPKLNNKRVLDLGCGTGEHCMDYVRLGASKVTGIDISGKMLKVARDQNSDPKITYINMPMEDITMIDDTFDVAVSSLAFHYVEDFAGVVKRIYELLTPGGIFVFSQENPINTCHEGGDRWTRDADGNKLFCNLKNYSVEGERESVWFVDNVKKYHRTFSTIVNTLADAGFFIQKMIEPGPTEEILKEYPEQADLYHKPDFLLVRAVKM